MQIPIGIITDKHRLDLFGKLSNNDRVVLKTSSHAAVCRPSSSKADQSPPTRPAHVCASARPRVLAMPRKDKERSPQERREEFDAAILQQQRIDAAVAASTTGATWIRHATYIDTIKQPGTNTFSTNTDGDLLYWDHRVGRAGGWRNARLVTGGRQHG